MGGFEGGEAEGFGDGTHDEDVGDVVNVAELFATNEASENDVVGNVEVGGETDEFFALFTVASEDEEEFVVFLESEGGGAHHIEKAFLHSEATDGGDDGIAGGFEGLEVVIISVGELVGAVKKIATERIIDNVNFRKRDVIFFVDEIFSIFRDGEDFVSVKETLVFYGMNQGVAAGHASAVEFGGVDVGDEGDIVTLFGENAGFVGQPVVGVDEGRLVGAEVLVDELTIEVLDVADGVVGMATFGGDDLFDNFLVVGGDAVFIERVEFGGGEDLHVSNTAMVGRIWDDKINV